MNKFIELAPQNSSGLMFNGSQHYIRFTPCCLHKDTLFPPDRRWSPSTRGGMNFLSWCSCCELFPEVNQVWENWRNDAKITVVHNLRSYFDECWCLGKFLLMFFWDVHSPWQCSPLSIGCVCRNSLVFSQLCLSDTVKSTRNYCRQSTSVWGAENALKCPKCHAFISPLLRPWNTWCFAPLSSVQRFER